VRASSVAFFVALLASALVLGPALAHAFEMPAKMGLSREQYFVVQQIYRGWDKIAFLLFGQIAALLATAWLTRREKRVLVPTLLAIAFVLGAQAMFWTYTYPANVATANWTVQPDNWEQLRRRWEYSHLVGAGLQLLALASLVIAVVSRLPSRKRAYIYY
jgi:hypothetical protein